MKIAGAFLLIASTIAAFGQAESSQPNLAVDPSFKLTIGCSSDPKAENPPSHVVVSSEASSFWVRKTNTTDYEIVSKSRTGEIYGYHLEIRDSDGREVGPRHPNEVIMADSDKGGIPTDPRQNLLLPRASTIDILPLAKRFDIRKPGDYTIQVWAHVSDDPKSDIVKSNIITVTVLPPPPQAEEPK
jgi:hypothetical protein